MLHYGNLYYSVSKFENNLFPRFDKLNVGNYSSFGKQPTVSLLYGDEEASTFLELHLSDLDHIKYQVFTLEGAKLEMGNSGSVGMHFAKNLK